MRLVTANRAPRERWRARQSPRSIVTAFQNESAFIEEPTQVSAISGEACKLKAPDILQCRGLDLIGRRPTLPPTRAGSTIGAAGLNYRVRDGNGWDPCATITQK